MSWDDGWAAVHLEMPPRIPRIEADAQVNWNLVRAVTGIEVYPHSDPETRADASAAFMRAWNYDLTLGAVIHCSEFGDHRSFMGHAEYADGAVDLDDFMILKQNFGTAGPMGDGNDDGAVDLDDFMLLKQQFGTAVAPAVEAEPADLLAATEPVRIETTRAARTVRRRRAGARRTRPAERPGLWTSALDDRGWIV